MSAYLTHLGASRIVPRAQLAPEQPRPVGSETWNHAIDAVGGRVLATLLAQLRRGAVAIACGNAGGNEVPANVLPFLLRGVRLIGIESSMQPLAARHAAWDRLARDLPLDKLAAMTETIGLADLPDAGRRILEGRVRGRIVVDLAR
jgi:acrylyl-CoA reductase (NADPH)